MVRHGSATPSPPVQVWVAPPKKIKKNLTIEIDDGIIGKLLKSEAAVIEKRIVP